MNYKVLSTVNRTNQFKLRAVPTAGLGVPCTKVPFTQWSPQDQTQKFTIKFTDIAR